MSNVIKYQYALRILDASFLFPAFAVTSPALPRETVVKLFDLMPVASGILRTRGTDITADIKEDVTQAIIGATWHANGDLLMEHQPEIFAKWVRAFTVTP